MSTDQLLEALAAAVSAAQPLQEYCFLGFWGVTWWPLCMTKAEWAGWAQAVGATVAVLISILIVRREIRQRRIDKDETRIKELRAIRLVLDKHALEGGLNNYISSFTNFSSRYKNETKFMADFNNLFLFNHTFKSFQDLKKCIDSIPLKEMESLKLSFIGDDVRRINLDIQFIDTIYAEYLYAVKKHDFLKKPISSSEFFKEISGSESSFKTIEQELKIMTAMLIDWVVILRVKYSLLNKKLYG